MKYYSDVLRKFYDTEKDCVQAEAQYKKEQDEKAKAEAKKAETRKARAEEVEAAMKAATDARKKYEKLLNEFCKDYGTFHYSFNSKDEDLNTLFNFLF